MTIIRMDIPRVEAARPKLDQGVQTVIQLNTRFSSIMYQVEGVIAGRRSIRSRFDRSAMRLRELDRQLRSLKAFMNEAETRYGGVERSLEEQAERLTKSLVQITAAWGAGLSLGGPGGIAAIGMQALVVRGVLEGLQDCWSTGLISKRNWPASPYSFANQSAQLLPYNPEKVIPMNDILNRADPEVYERLMAGPFGHMTLEQRTALIQEVEQSEKDAKRAMERFEYGSSFADGFGHGIERKIQGIVDTVNYVWTNPKGAGEALLQGIKDELVDKVKHPFKTMSMVTNPILYGMMNQLPKPETVKDFMEAGPGKKGDYIGPLFVDLVLAAAAARIKVKDLPGSKENPKIRDGDSKGAEQDVKEKEKKEQATIGAEGTGEASSASLAQKQKEIIKSFNHLSDFEKNTLIQRAREGIISPEKWTGNMTGIKEFKNADEFAIADKWLQEGKNVEKLADVKGADGNLVPGADFNVDGMIIEAKTANSKNINTTSKKAIEAINRQGENVLIDGRKIGYTVEEAKQIIEIINRKTIGKGNVEIWLNDGSVIKNK